MFFKRFITAVLIVTSYFTAFAQASSDVRKTVTMETNKGTIVLELYNETPQHRDNFVKLVKSGFYDGMLFHRVISDFMIQAGDPASRNAEKGQRLGATSDTTTIPAEIRFPTLFHKRGALCAAREGDSDNPQRASSATQFYIVYGSCFNDATLDRMQERISSKTDGTAVLTEEIREVYRTVGGTPHLDGQYTVFGEVIKGMDVVKDIQAVATDENDRPVEDVVIIKATVDF